MDTAKITAPKDWSTTNLQWYEDTPEKLRAEYAREHCSKVWSWDGQNCVVISYPRQNGKVAVYDLDYGTISWLALVDLKDIFASEPVRDSTENDFTYSRIRESLVVDEAGDISRQLFDR